MSRAGTPLPVFAQRLAGRLSRRAGLGAALAALAALAAPDLGEANKKKKKKKSATFCLNGQTVTTKNRKQQQSLTRQGATPGSCPTPGGCPSGQKDCNGACVADTACCTDADCPNQETCKRGTCARYCDAGGPCRVFVTATSYAGNGFGGIPGADALCQSTADGAGLIGTFRAWISDASSTVADRFTNTAQAGPYVLVANAGDGGNPPPTVSADFAMLTGCGSGGDCLQNPINRTATGAEQATTTVWTGTSPEGSAGTSCTNWSTKGFEFSGLVGITSEKNFAWTSLGPYFCDGNYALYCFEQA